MDDPKDGEGALPVTRRKVLTSSVAVLAAAHGTSLGVGALVGEAEAGGAGTTPAAATGEVTIASYIVRRLRQHGCKALFGVPGATCDPFFEAAAELQLPIIVTSGDLEAGYAADGYARMRGLGAVAVTYGVGTLSLVNAIAGAYAERSPVVVINGGPSSEDIRVLREEGTLFSHSVGPASARTVPDAPGDERYLSDLPIFRRVTAFARRIPSQAEAARLIDEAITVALRERRPVYIEVPKHLWLRPVPSPGGALNTALAASGNEQRQAEIILRRLAAASKPAIILGTEVQRYGLADPVAVLLAKLQVPWSTTLLAKSALSEHTRGFVGVYDGERAPRSTRRAIEGADALLALGCVFGRQYRNLVREAGDKLVQVSDGNVRIGRGQAEKGDLKTLIGEMQRRPWQARENLINAARLPGLTFAERRDPPRTSPVDTSDTGLSHDELMQTVSNFHDANFVAITDTSLSMYPAADLDIDSRNAFLCNALWQSIGYSLGAAVGVGMAEIEAAPGGNRSQARRPLVVCGDGGFQMTVQALSTLKRQRVRAIVIVLDNGLYAIEQFVVEAIKGISPSNPQSYFKDPAVAPVPYLGLERWNYADIAKAMGFEFTRKVVSAQGLATALRQARDATGPALITAVVKPRSIPTELRES